MSMKDKPFESVKIGDYFWHNGRISAVTRVTDHFFFCGNTKINKAGRVLGTDVFVAPATKGEFDMQVRKALKERDEQWRRELAEKRASQPEEKRICDDISSFLDHNEAKAVKLPLWRLRIAYVAFFGNPDDTIDAIAIDALTPVK